VLREKGFLRRYGVGISGVIRLPHWGLINFATLLRYGISREELWLSSAPPLGKCLYLCARL